MKRVKIPSRAGISHIPWERQSLDWHSQDYASGSVSNIIVVNASGSVSIITTNKNLKVQMDQLQRGFPIAIDL